MILYWNWSAVSLDLFASRFYNVSHMNSSERFFFCSLFIKRSLDSLRSLYRGLGLTQHVYRYNSSFIYSRQQFYIVELPKIFNYSDRHVLKCLQLMFLLEEVLAHSAVKDRLNCTTWCVLIWTLSDSQSNTPGEAYLYAAFLTEDK